MEHIYECKHFNDKTTEMPFEKIFNGNLNEQNLFTKDLSFPVVDFAALSQSWGSVGKLGLQSN